MEKALIDRILKTWPSLKADEVEESGDSAKLVHFLKTRTGEAEAAIRTWLYRFHREISHDG